MRFSIVKSECQDQYANSNVPKAYGSRMADLPTSGEMVTAAMAAVDAQTESDLAYVLRTRYGIKPTQSQINRWRNDKSSPASNTPLCSCTLLAG